MHKRLIKTSLVFCLISAVLVASAFVGIKLYFNAFAHQTQVISQAIIDIPRGTSLRKVSELLQEHKIIDNARIYYWYLRLGSAYRHKIQAGYYQFDGTMTNEAIAQSLRSGHDRAYKIIFKEGETLADLVNTLKKNNLVSEAQFIAAMTKSEILQLIPVPEVKDRKELKNDMGGLEGYLFPDTYFFTKKDSAENIIKKMHQRLIDKLDVTYIERIKEISESLHSVLTLAAIVEKETGDPGERQIIASVYRNRLIKKMRLQADPTVIYGIKDYNGKITRADLINFHTYNTYKIEGLPPGPIASPGLESIRAVLWPSETNFLYFVSKNDGTHIFCENLACHNRAVKKWQIDYWKAKAHAKN